jgi:prenylated cyclic peptide (anacyclamide/piricyclamide family)
VGERELFKHKLLANRNFWRKKMKNKTVMPKQTAPVDRLSPATAAGAAGGGGVVPLWDSKWFGGNEKPFAGDDAE